MEGNELLQMARDEFGHLEHADLALAIKYRPELVVRVDHDSFLFVLQTALFDVAPKLFCKHRCIRLTQYRRQTCKPLIMKHLEELRISEEET